MQANHMEHDDGDPEAVAGEPIEYDWDSDPDRDQGEPTEMVTAPEEEVADGTDPDTQPNQAEVRVQPDSTE